MINRRHFIKICALTGIGIGLPNLAKAGGKIDLEMSNWVNGDGSYNGQIIDFIITNNSSKKLKYAEVSIILLKNKKIVSSTSRPITDIPSGGFISKRFYFNNAPKDFTHYRFSCSKLRF